MKIASFLLGGLASLALVPFLSSASVAQQPSKPELRVGFVPGPYIDEFKIGVEPELKKKGYKIRYVEFSTGLEANNAVFKSEIDANVMQHTVFLNSYNERQKTDLVGIVHVPTPPMGLYSKKHPLGTPIKPGSSVAVPNDPVNLQRALWVLRDLGLIEIRDSKPVDVTELDVIKNPGGIKIVPLEAAQAPRALDDVDAAAINTNYATQAGLDPVRDPILREDPKGPYVNLIAVRSADKDKPWVKTLVDSYRTPEVKEFVLTKFKGAVLPSW